MVYHKRPSFQSGHHVTLLTEEPLEKRDLRLPSTPFENMSVHYTAHSPYLKRRQALFLKKFQELHRTTPFHILHLMDNSGRWIAKYKHKLKICVATDVEATHICSTFSPILGLLKSPHGAFYVQV